jgi:hypothetical protein
MMNRQPKQTCDTCWLHCLFAVEHYMGMYIGTMLHIQCTMYKVSGTSYLLLSHCIAGRPLGAAGQPRHHQH